jgi:transcriptional regulator with XRE-family HTH domain
MSSARIQPIFPEFMRNDPVKERIFAEESLVVDVMDRLAGWMTDHNITRAELARRLGTSPANVTQMLRGRNVSLRTLAAAVHVMGGAVDFTIQPAAGERAQDARDAGTLASPKNLYYLHPQARPGRRASALGDQHARAVCAG